MSPSLNECLLRRPIAVCLLLGIAACASASPDGRSASTPPAAAGSAPTPLSPGPPATRFVGEPVAQLEALIGEPALVRREGQNEFRRYDLEKCRAYAVVMPAGGEVVSLETGATVRGQAAPSFAQCTARPAGPGV